MKLGGVRDMNWLDVLISESPWDVAHYNDRGGSTVCGLRQFRICYSQ
jgi:hypothetical protein